jgi:hypothetical protein
MCSTSEDRPVRRGPRDLANPWRRLLYSERHDQWRELSAQHGPAECQIHTEEFDRAERVVELVTTAGLDASIPMMVVDGRAVDVTEPIRTVLRWCAECPFQRLCYEDMTASGRYTGIAGGEILHRGEPYKPRKGRVKKWSRANQDADACAQRRRSEK